MTDSSHPRRTLREQVQWITELAEHTVDSAHDRAGIETQLIRASETLEAAPALCAGEEKK